MGYTTHPALGRCLVMFGHRIAIIRGAHGRRILYVEHRRTHAWWTLPLLPSWADHSC